MTVASSSAIPRTGSLQTESRNNESAQIDIVSTEEMCRIINAQDATVALAVQKCIPEIARTIDLITERVRKGGRVLYIGAGTSGRLGVLDASEISPPAHLHSPPHTTNSSHESPSIPIPHQRTNLFQKLSLIAGSDTAIRRAVEGAEDSTTRPIDDLSAIVPPINALDTLIGIAASGRTPYVLAGLEYCKGRDLLTVGISCVSPSEMRGRTECLVECVVGAEVVTGSTRMKAGTATKMILNMISTGVMIRIGKTHGNLMVDVKSSNNKLIDRARRIFRTLHPQTSRSDIEIDVLIASCDGSVKLAAVVEKLQCSVDDARAKLEAAGGVMRKAWLGSDAPPPSSAPQSPRLVLAVDAGGTKCTALIANNDGIRARAEAGPCNFITRGHDAALLTMSEAINQAIDLVPESVLLTSSRPQIPLVQPLFVAAWIGGAGLDRPADLESVHARISKLLSLPDPTTLLVTNDAALLSSAIIKHDERQQPQTKTGVVLVTGTGSIAKSFALTSASRKLVSTSIERAGGWGYLLGDEGSAYYIGREAIRHTLRHRDLGHPPTPFHQRVAAHLGCTSILGIISAVYAPDQFREDHDAKALDADPKLRVASLCPVVFAAAFPARAQEADDEALEIVREGVKGAVDALMCLLEDKERVKPRESTLVLGGALGQVKEYREELVRELKERGEVFAFVEAISDAAGCAIELLRRNFLASSSEG